VTTHWMLLEEKCSSLAIVGKATLTIATSRTTMNWASASKANSTHLFSECFDKFRFALATKPS
jgi:hypothetical protein